MSENLQTRLKEKIDQRVDENKIKRTRKLISIISIVGILATIGLAIYAWNLGLFTDQEKVHTFIKKSGMWGPVFFLLLQIAQCIIPIIPGGITSVVGVFLFGPIQGFILNFLGIYIGEVIIFLMARALGTTFVRAAMPEDSYQKYSKWINENDAKIRKFFIWTMVLPGMPDDIICMIMGLTNMSLKYYMFHLAWTKIPSLFLYTVFLEQVASQGGQILQWFKNLITR